MRKRGERRSADPRPLNAKTGSVRQLSAVRAALGQEIAKRERMEALLRKAEKLAAIGRLALCMAHEINNPLAGIKNSLLLLKSAGPKEHPYYDYYGRVEREIDRIAEIVRHMFDLHSRRSESRCDFKPAEALAEVVAVLDVHARQKNVAIELDARNASSVMILPEGLFKQVLLNVVLNAIEASPPGGVVKIAARSQNGTLVVTVADQGSGISKEARGDIFEAFYSTKPGRAHGGLGLGLFVSKAIIDEMGGDIGYVSEEGAGTIFTITLYSKRNIE